jgi:hypothetical protein
MTATAISAGSASAHPQQASMTATAAEAATAAQRTGPRMTRTAATMLPRYTARKSVVGIATSAAGLTTPKP